jgi:hypothetical protein
MDNTVITWLVIFAVAASIFFAVSAVVTVKGFADLLALLRGAGDKADLEEAPGRTEGSDE